LLKALKAFKSTDFPQSRSSWSSAYGCSALNTLQQGRYSLSSSKNNYSLLSLS